MVVFFFGLFSWYVCGYCFCDDVFEFVLYCVDIIEVGGLKFSEVISEVFVNFFYIGFFLEIDGFISRFRFCCFSC